MTANRRPSESVRVGTQRVVIVLAKPDDTLVASLRSIGLAPVAEDGEVVVWAKAPLAPLVNPTPPPERPSGTNAAVLLMNIADAALALGIGRSTVYELIGRGDLDVVHVGRSARVPADALRALVERLRADQAPHRWRRAAG